MVAEVYPLEKVVLNGTSIALGMPQTAVEARLGKGDSVKNRRYYFNSDLAIHYAQDGTVEYIEFLGGVDGSLNPVLYEVSAFDVPADALVNMLRDKNGGAMLDTEHGYSYAFPNLSVGIYREGLASHWATLGIGVPRLLPLTFLSRDRLTSNSIFWNIRLKFS